MNRQELKKEVAFMNIRIIDGDGFKDLHITDNSYKHLASISERHQNLFNFDVENLAKSLTPIERKYLQELILEYSSTPLNERNPRYHLKHKWLAEGKCYLNYFPSQDFCYLGNKHDSTYFTAQASSIVTGKQSIIS